MAIIVLASFLAGSILSLVLPTALLVALWLWYRFEIKRVPGPPPPTPRGATPENPPAANPATGGQPPVGEAHTPPS